MASFNDSSSVPRNPIPSSPISIVDIFFPGFTNISAAFQQLQANNKDSYAQMLCIFGIVVFIGRYAYNYVNGFVDTYFTSTIHISDTDEAYDMLVAWLSSQPFTDNVSSSLVSVGARKRRYARGHSDKSLKKPLHYSPWNGAFTFWYKKHLITFRSMQREDPFNSSKEDVSISCVGRSSKILKELLNECREKYLASVKNKTTIFKHDNGSWDKKNAVEIRQSNSVIIDQKDKTALLEDIRCFLESQTWYSAKGIPHRKGYLFYGPPGTGKSSLSLLIAGECDLDIYILKLSRLDDDSLDQLFSALPERCLVLIEDIDAVDATHSRQRRTVTLRQGDTSSSAKEHLHGKVSLSALLNTIDGIGSQQGRLLIMTTNHLDRLDEALIRPGRVDKKLKLGLTTHDINAQLFFNTFERNAPNDKDKAEDDKELKKIAEEFANKVPENEFSPAEIQLFLVANRKSPAMAIHNLQEWIAKIREEKRKHTAPSCESGGSGRDHDIALNDARSSSATPQDCVQARETTNTVAGLETSKTVKKTHCCSCQVIEDIIGICTRERHPSVEKSLLLSYLSDLEAYRRTHADRAHSTHGFLNLLLDFAKKTYGLSAESYSTPLATSSNSLSLPPPASNDFLTLSQPASKIADLDLEKFWDEKGWEHIVFDSEDAAPGIPSRLLDSFDSGSSEMSPDSASSGTSFESGSEISSDAENIVEHVNKREGERVAAKFELYRHPVTPPASPELSTPAVQSDSEGNETRPSSGFAGALEDALKDARWAKS